MPSLKAAIKAYCKSCTYDDTQPGTYLQQIEACTVKSCKLYEVRPMTVATITLHRNKKDTGTSQIDSILDGLEDEDEDESEPEPASAV